MGQPSHGMNGRCNAHTSTTQPSNSAACMLTITG